MAPPKRANRRRNHFDPEESSFIFSSSDGDSSSNDSFDSVSTVILETPETDVLSEVNASTSAHSVEQLRMGCCTSRIDNDPSIDEVARSGGPGTLDVIDVIELRDRPVTPVASQPVAGPSSNRRQVNNLTNSLVTSPALSMDNPIDVVMGTPESGVHDSTENLNIVGPRRSLRTSGNAISPRPAVRRSPRVSNGVPAVAGSEHSGSLSENLSELNQDGNLVEGDNDNRRSNATLDIAEASPARTNVFVHQEGPGGLRAVTSTSLNSVSLNVSIGSSIAENRNLSLGASTSGSGSIRRSLRLSGGGVVEQAAPPASSSSTSFVSAVSSRAVPAVIQQDGIIGSSAPISVSDTSESESESDVEMEVDSEENPGSKATTPRRSNRVNSRPQVTPSEFLSSTLIELHETDDRPQPALRQPSMSPISPSGRPPAILGPNANSSPQDSELADTTWINFMRDKDFILKSGFSIPRRSFAKLAKGVVLQSSPGYKIGTLGLEALQVAMEEFIIETFKNGRIITRARKASVTKPKDLRSALKIRKERFYRELAPVQERRRRRKKNRGLNYTADVPIGEAITPSP